MLRRMGPVIAGLVLIGALALAPSAAVGHPEECSTAAAWTVASTYTPYTSWEGAEDSLCTNAGVERNYDDSGARLAEEGETGTKNLKLLSSTPKSGVFAPVGAFNSDIAFEDGYAYQGNYRGIQVWNVKEPEDPVLVSGFSCPGAQNDVTVNDGIMITSTDAIMSDDSCSATSLTSANYNSPTAWEGLKVFDVSNPAAPKLLKSVETDCGSHTHTVIPQDDKLIVYASSYDISTAKPDCQPPHDKISVVEVPKSDPSAARIVNEPVLFPDGGYPGDTQAGRSATRGCHDITVYPAIDLAAGACTGEGAMIDISDPVNPEVISSIEDPNFAFWHSATISQDGDQVLFTDEKGGGNGAECNPTVGPKRGADAIYDISNPSAPRFLSYYKIPRTQTNEENCVAHNGNAIPVEGRDILVQSWYQGGISVIDWTDGSNPKELGWFDRGPFDETKKVLSGFWSSYYYNGFIYGSEIERGWDVFRFTDPVASGASRNKTSTLNAQTQFPLR